MPGRLLDSAHGAAGGSSTCSRRRPRPRWPAATPSPASPESLPAARLPSCTAPHHDVLNDQQHRSVAAEIVLLLEALRGGRPTPLITTETSSW
ncbi:hypothetical protein [Streptomyces sp. KL116D]|uniref:hypothetical protein n=1 Tax=Streptomyces sp. KL116D TaxID=3045152 RepID=UPI0035573791